MKNKTYKGIGGTCGVMPYVMDGKSIGVFLSPEELFKSASKLIDCPVVIKSHDSAKNKDKNTVGIVTKAYPLDNFSLGVDMQIWDDDAQKYIENGNIELSAGYTATLAAIDNHWYGSTYSYQKQIDAFDHIVILPKGDARNRVSKLILNSSNEDIETENNKDFIFNLVESSSTTVSSSLEKMGKKEIKLTDSSNQPKTFEVDEEVATRIGHLESEVNRLSGQVREFNNSSNSDTSTIATLRTEIKDSKSTFETTIKEKDDQIAALKANLPSYLTIANKASQLGVTVDYEKFDPLLVMRSALKDSYPGIDEQSEETVSFLFKNLKIPTSTTETPPETTTTTTTDSNTTTTASPLKNKVETVVTANTAKATTSTDMASAVAAKRKAGK